MRFVGWLACLAVTGCAGISTVPFDSSITGPLATAGTPYSLPKGVVPVQVFIDQNGVGVTIEQAAMVSDSQAGILVARTQPSILNKEDMKLTVDTETGLLTAVSSESEAKLQEIVTELAKTAGRFALQNAKASFFSDKVVVLKDRFDPLDPADLARVNTAINAAIQRAVQAFIAGGGQLGSRTVSRIDLSLDGAPVTAPVPGPQALRNCALGICVRAMTSRTLRVSIDGISYDTKDVKLPSREIIAVPVPQSVLANQKVNIVIKDGILNSYHLERDSEALGLVKTVGAIPGALLAGMLQGLDDQKQTLEKQKGVVEADTNLTKAGTDLLKAQKENADTSIKLQNTTFGGASKAYEAAVLKIYPYTGSLSSAVREMRTKRNALPAPGSRDGDLLGDKR
jgi:hypothetical protein